jgi:hypothetical protein
VGDEKSLLETVTSGSVPELPSDAAADVPDDVPLDDVPLAF